MNQNISQVCQEKRHTECSGQIPKRGGPETTNCQCECHPNDMGTFVGATGTVEDRK